MQSILFEEAKQNLDGLCQKSCQDHEPYIIHRADNNHVVVLSLDDFNGWQETLYLLSNSANAERLLHSLKSARAGNLIEHKLIDE